MNLIAFDPYANPSLAASANVEIVDSLDELLEQADFLTLHTPLIASTKGMIGDTELAKMKKTARILNVARGGMIDETALLSALEAGTIAGAGIDVFTAEPPIPDDAASKLIAHPKVIATPHLGASTAEAQENVSIDVCTQVLSILSGQLPRSAGKFTMASKICYSPRLTRSQSTLPSFSPKSTAPFPLSSRS
jgi:D-3-phosphoglycerate dehydrogenase